MTTEGNDMTRTVLITGCSSGFGKAAATKSHDRGWNVVATMRDPGDWDGGSSDRLLTHALDVTDPTSTGRGHIQAYRTAAPRAFSPTFFLTQGDAICRRSPMPAGHRLGAV
jgi:NAD(P)-dependent dehydrogenase (short-subunit alcohol dehydrogenase family)